MSLSEEIKAEFAKVRDVLHRVAANFQLPTEEETAKLHDDIEAIASDADEAVHDTETAFSDAVSAVEKPAEVQPNATVPAPAGNGTETVDPPGVTSPKDQPSETPADPLAGLSDDEIRALAASKLSEGSASA